MTAVEVMGFGASAKGVTPFINSTSLTGDLGTGLFEQSGTIGTLILLVVYIMATIGKVRLVFFPGQTTVRRWERPDRPSALKG